MHLEGSFETPTARSVVWDFLLNPNQIAPCFSDLQSLEVTSPDSFRAKVKVGISVVRGTMDFEFRIDDKRPPTSATLLGTGRGVGSTVEMQTKFTLNEITTGTAVGWAADVNVGGVMAGLGAKLLESTSRKMVEQVLENLKEKLRAKTGT
jgi:carbon monoxide dehydrogenase subunit G